MGYAVALGGKGGTGKTTIAGLLIRYMLNHGMKPLLAIDADSNSNLNDVLGVPLEETLSEAREEMKTSVPVGMTKDIFMEMKVEQALVEGGGVRSDRHGPSRRSGLLLCGEQSSEQPYRSSYRQLPVHRY